MWIVCECDFIIVFNILKCYTKLSICAIGTYAGGTFMDTGKDVSDFKRFIELNREKLYANSVKADDISVNDEWMQENQWDEIYERQVKNQDG